MAAKNTIKSKEAAKLSNNKLSKGIVKDTSKGAYGKQRKRQTGKRSTRKSGC